MVAVTSLSGLRSASTHAEPDHDHDQLETYVGWRCRHFLQRGNAFWRRGVSVRPNAIRTHQESSATESTSHATKFVHSLFCERSKLGPSR